MIYDNDDTAVQWREGTTVLKNMLHQLDIYVEKDESLPLSHMIQTYFRQTEDTNVQGETIRPSEEQIEDYLYELGVFKDFKNRKQKNYHKGNTD